MVDSINRLSLRYISGVRTLRDLIVMILTIAAIIAVLTACLCWWSERYSLMTYATR